MGRVRALEKLSQNFQDTKIIERKSIDLDLRKTSESGVNIVEAYGISFAHKDDNKINIISNFSLKIIRNSRIGIIGANGTGKTTLIKILQGFFSPTTGRIKVGEHIKIKYFDQNKECIDLSKRLAKKVADELSIPIYLYEKSASSPSRVDLADIRIGEYEGLSKKLKSNDWKPDYGPIDFNPKSGATAIGVRNFLIAYNINLNTTDQRVATDIAFELREKGRSKRNPNPKSSNLLDGDIVRNKDGSPVKIKGIFKDVKAVGWYIEEYKRAQISINLNDYKTSSIYDVFDTACKLAYDRGVRVTGSELVGLVPLDAIISTGKHYLRKQSSFEGIPENEIIECAVQSLGLNDLCSFNPNKKIIEYAISDKANKLVYLMSLLTHCKL